MHIGKFAVALGAAFTMQLAVAAPTNAQSETASVDEARMLAAAKVVQRARDAWRARNFEGWIANFAPDVVIVTDSGSLTGRDNMRRIFKPVFDMNVPDPAILDSGWTGQKIYIHAREFGPDGSVLGESYAEYEVRAGKIISINAVIL